MCMHKIKYNMQQLRINLQYKAGREMSWNEIAEGAGITQRTMYSWIHNKTSRIDMDTMARMLDFCHKQGYKIEFKDFFTVTNEPEPTTTNPPKPG